MVRGINGVNPALKTGSGYTHARKLSAQACKDSTLVLGVTMVWEPESQLY